MAENVTMEIINSEQFKRANIRFTGKPSEEIRNELKKEGWIYSRNHNVWYPKNTAAENSQNFANHIKETYFPDPVEPEVTIITENSIKDELIVLIQNGAPLEEVIAKLDEIYGEDAVQEAFSKAIENISQEELNKGFLDTFNSNALEIAIQNKINGDYIHIQQDDEYGWDYTSYTKDYREIDGGVGDDVPSTKEKEDIREVAKIIIKNLYPESNLSDWKATNWAVLQAKVEAVEAERYDEAIKNVQKYWEEHDNGVEQARDEAESREMNEEIARLDSEAEDMERANGLREMEAEFPFNTTDGNIYPDEVNNAKAKFGDIIRESFLTLTDEEKENGSSIEGKAKRYNTWFKPMVDEIMDSIIKGDSEIINKITEFDLTKANHVKENKWYSPEEAYYRDVQYHFLPELYNTIQEKIKKQYEEEKIPYVVMFSSESPIFPSENRVYTVKEFNDLLTKADSDFHNRKKYAEEKYGSADNYWDLERDDKLPEEDKGIQFGYDKTNFKFFNIPNPNNPEDTFSYEPSRYDIGDGNGSVFDYVRTTCSHDEFIEALNELERNIYFSGINTEAKLFVRNAISKESNVLKTNLTEKMEALNKAQEEYKELHKKWLIEASEAERVDEKLKVALDEIKETYDSSIKNIYTTVLNEYPFEAGNVSESEFLKFTANEVKSMVVSELFLPSRDAQKAMNAEDYKAYNSVDWAKLRRIWEKFPAPVNMTSYVESILQDSCNEKGLSVQEKENTISNEQVFAWNVEIDSNDWLRVRTVLTNEMVNKLHLENTEPSVRKYTAVVDFNSQGKLQYFVMQSEYLDGTVISDDLNISIETASEELGIDIFEDAKRFAHAQTFEDFKFAEHSSPFSYTNEILDKIRAAGFEVITDKEKFERILEQEERIQKMTLENGLTYGFVHNGKIYLNPEIINSNAAVHEYTHLWDAYTQKTNPELWNKGLEIFKDTKYWNEVISDPNYQDIKDDENLVLSEIHARIQGDIAEQVLNRIAELDGDETKLNAIDWDQEVMEFISSSLDLPVELKNSEELKNFLTMPLKDLVDEKNISVPISFNYEDFTKERYEKFVQGYNTSLAVGRDGDGEWYGRIKSGKVHTDIHIRDNGIALEHYYPKDDSLYGEYNGVNGSFAYECYPGFLLREEALKDIDITNCSYEEFISFISKECIDSMRDNEEVFEAAKGPLVSWEDYATEKARLSKIIVFDTETTGITPGQDELLQVSIIDGNGKTLFNNYVKPEHKTEWQNAQAINGISPETVKDAASIKEYIPELQKIFDNADVLVSYNGIFDVGFLEAAGIKIGSNKPHLDVMKAFAPVFSEKTDHPRSIDGYKYKKLSEAGAYYNFDYKAHDSLGDTTVTLEVAKRIYGNSLERLTEAEMEKYSANSVNERKPYNFFVNDTANLDLGIGAEFDAITGLTAEKAALKYAELKDKGFSPYIGINIPGDFIFDDKEGQGAGIFTEIEGRPSFYIGDHFVKGLKINNDHAKNVIAAYKELYENVDKYILDVERPGFLFEKEAELNVPIKPIRVFSFSPFGFEGSIIEVETDMRPGIQAYDIVGLADSAVKESRERIWAALRNSGIGIPSERILQSLSPADIKKDSPLDLSMALGIMSQTTQYPVNESVLALGELELSGKIRPVRGARAAVTSAKSYGITNVICDPVTAELIKDIEGINILTAEDLNEVNEKLLNPESFEMNVPVIENTEEVKFNEEYLEDYKEALENLPMEGHFETVRAIQIAVAGKHNILATGAPGCGKTLLTQTLMPVLTPKLTKDEAQSIARINSLAGLDSPKRDNLIPPFRMPHQTATIEGICGGGPNCRPGEISLAHQGTLFMDEAAEFRTSVIQMLRVPLESKSITLSRAGRSTVYPAGFQLAMAMNPCPCGNLHSDGKICLDSARSIEQYWKKISDPLLDRIEIKTFVQKDENDKRKMSIDELKKQIATAYEIQRKRGVYNNQMTPEQIQQYCKLDEESQEFLNKREDLFTPRGRANLLKLSLTIANMDGREEIHINDIKEAHELSAPVFEKPNKFVYIPEENKKTISEEVSHTQISQGELDLEPFDDKFITSDDVIAAKNEKDRIVQPILNGEKSGMWKAFEDFDEHGVFDIRGKELALTKTNRISETGYKQLQAAMNIYRDKRFETFRYVLVDRHTGEITDQLAISSHLPNVCAVSDKGDDTLKKIISRAEEKDCLVVAVHNHPSGNTKESTYDVETTDSLRKSLKRSDGLERFAGHIILDHDSFNLYTPRKGWHTVESINQEEDKLEKKNNPEWTKSEIDSATSLISLAKTLNDTYNWNDDFIPVVFTNADNRISGVQYYHKDYFSKDPDIIREDFQFEAMGVGAVSAFPVVTEHLMNKLIPEDRSKLVSTMKALVEDNVITDCALSDSTVSEKFSIPAGKSYYESFIKKEDRKNDIQSTWDAKVDPHLFPPASSNDPQDVGESIRNLKTTNSELEKKLVVAEKTIVLQQEEIKKQQYIRTKDVTITLPVRDENNSLVKNQDGTTKKIKIHCPKGIEAKLSQMAFQIEELQKENTRLKNLYQSKSVRPNFEDAGQDMN
ncbi:MAG: YifB family Mg chelatase-like AAA ATPase [Treponema sp.]|nr:YifB family Mg chelatase-like AAA ATPase [Treponema sp.]